jgi:hypothetical protein
MIAEERTGWRDPLISERHRAWGYDCPAVDIDFMVIEYDKAEPKALVEYKNQRTPVINLKKHPSIMAMVSLANKAGLPAFIVRYADDFSWWKVAALNDEAMDHLHGNPTLMSEVEWVRTLYAVRGLTMPDGLAERIEALPPVIR